MKDLLEHHGIIVAQIGQKIKGGKERYVFSHEKTSQKLKGTSKKRKKGLSQIALFDLSPVKEQQKTKINRLI